MMIAARTVREAMTPSVATLKRNDVLSIADDVMRLGRIRHLPVVDDDDATMLVGIVTQRDLFRGSLVRALGVRHFEIFPVGQDRAGTVRRFGERILPQLQRT